MPPQCGCKYEPISAITPTKVCNQGVVSGQKRLAKMPAPPFVFFGLTEMAGSAASAIL
jgi:hypothetical protein